MTTIPLGTTAYKRVYAGDPEIKLINRFLEKNPTNPVEQTALITRPGEVSIANCAGGANRGCASFTGLFNGDLFVVFGTNLYRISSDGTVLPIAGVVADHGHVWFSWMKGIGYELLFISDGSVV